MNNTYFDSLPICEDMSVLDSALYEDNTKLASRYGYRVGDFLVYRFPFEPKKKSHWEYSLIYVVNKVDRTIKYDPTGFITQTLYCLENDMKKVAPDYAYKDKNLSKTDINFKLQIFKKYNGL